MTQVQITTTERAGDLTSRNTPAVARRTKPRVAVLFSRIGPYHFARLKAAGDRLDVTAVEYSNVDSTYAWSEVRGQGNFERRMLFSGTSAESQTAAQIFKTVNATLDQLHPEVVAIPGWYDRCSLAALRWCGTHGVPAVMMSESTAWDVGRKWWKEAVKRRLLSLCSAALVGGRAHAEYLEQLGMPRERIFLGYDAVDNDYFDKAAQEIRNRKSEIRNKHGLPERYFLASARFVEKKNLARLIEAYARYRELVTGARPWSLVLLGDGPLRSTLNSQLSTLNLQDFVHLPGFKQYDELPVYYACASAFVHASITEQWGLVVNEAMASGLPVLVSNRCGCAAELVQEGCNGYTFDPSNKEELSQLMIKISARDLNLEKMGQEGRRIIECWSLDIFAKNMKAACECAGYNHSAAKRYSARSAAGLLARLPANAFRGVIPGLDQTSVLNQDRVTGAAVVPNFFIIGAPKSGTTALGEYLKEHPNIYFSRVKEPHFFDFDASKSTKLKLHTYLSLFGEADSQLHRAVGEGSTGYLISRVAVTEILKFNPGARFIVMLRSPVDLVQSWHSEMYFEGVETVRKFETAWRLEVDRRLGKKIPACCWEPKKLFYSEWGRLGEQMERLYSVAGRDKVKAILFDDFVTDTAGVYEEVLSFLGVPSNGRTDFPVLNENKVLRRAWLQRGLAFSANYFRMVRAKSGLRLGLGRGLLPKLLFLNSKPVSREAIPPMLRAELCDFYRQDVQKLSNLLGRDLSSWVSKPAETA